MKNRLNDSERIEWINNDEGLYLLWKRSRKGLTVFVRENRAMLDRLILPVLTGGKRSHYLVYGDGYENV